MRSGLSEALAELLHTGRDPVGGDFVFTRYGLSYAYVRVALECERSSGANKSCFVDFDGEIVRIAEKRKGLARELVHPDGFHLDALGRQIAGSLLHIINFESDMT